MSFASSYFARNEPCRSKLFVKTAAPSCIYFSRTSSTVQPSASRDDRAGGGAGNQVEVVTQAKLGVDAMPLPQGVLDPLQQREAENARNPPPSSARMRLGAPSFARCWSRVLTV